MDIYERIRKRRIDLSLSQDELAQKVGYTSRSSINKIEAGLVDISLPKIEAFANALNTSTAYLMGWEDDPFYTNPETARLAQEAFEDPDTRILMSAKKDLSPESVRAVIDMVKLLRKKENPHLEEWPDEEYPDEENQDIYPDD